MVLAEYHNQERGLAWPSQKQLSEDCEMPERTVRACQKALEARGFITRVTKGNQYRPTTYRLNFEISTAQSHELVISEPAVPATSNNHRVTKENIYSFFFQD